MVFSVNSLVKSASPYLSTSWMDFTFAAAGIRPPDSFVADSSVPKILQKVTYDFSKQFLDSNLTDVFIGLGMGVGFTALGAVSAPLMLGVLGVLKINDVLDVFSFIKSQADDLAGLDPSTCVIAGAVLGTLVLGGLFLSSRVPQTRDKKIEYYQNKYRKMYVADTTDKFEPQNMIYLSEGDYSLLSGYYYGQWKRGEGSPKKVIERLLRDPLTYVQGSVENERALGLLSQAHYNDYHYTDRDNADFYKAAFARYGADVPTLGRKHHTREDKRTYYQAEYAESGNGKKGFFFDRHMIYLKQEDFDKHLEDYLSRISTEDYPISRLKEFLDDPMTHSAGIERDRAILVCRKMHEKFTADSHVLPPALEGFFQSTLRLYGATERLSPLVIDGSAAWKIERFTAVPIKPGKIKPSFIPQEKLRALAMGTIDQLDVYDRGEVVATVGFDYETGNFYVRNKSNSLMTSSGESANSSNAVISFLFPDTCQKEPFLLKTPITIFNVRQGEWRLPSFAIRLEEYSQLSSGVKVPFTFDKAVLDLLEKHYGEYQESDVGVRFPTNMYNLYGFDSGMIRDSSSHAFRPYKFLSSMQKTPLVFHENEPPASLLYNGSSKIIGMVHFTHRNIAPQGARPNVQKIGEVYFWDDLRKKGPADAITHQFYSLVRNWKPPVWE